MLSALLALTLAAATQQHADACPSAPVAPPPELAGWSSPVPVVAAAAPDRATVLPVGRSVRGALVPVAGVAFARQGGHVPAAGSQGGLFAFVVTAAGRYRIALDGAAWIDVVKDGLPVESIAHAHGPKCTGIRKMVDFMLQPGRYLLELSGSDGPTLALLVARVPG